jgi:putative glutamine amidotransferase
VQHRQAARGRVPTHSVRIDPDSRLARVMGIPPARATEAEVNSFHHQSADRLGQDLRPVAWAPDGIVEGIESTGTALYLGVQWHAESLVERPEQAALFRELVEQAAAYGSTTRARRAA